MNAVGQLFGKARAAVAPALQDISESGADLEIRKNREAIVQGLLASRVEWEHSFCADFCFHLKQNHVLLGIFFSHGLHPYDRCKRGFVFLSNCVAGFGFALLLVDDDGAQASGATAMIAGVTVSIILAIVNVVQVQALTCSCVQDGSMCARYGGRGVTRGVESFGAWLACCCWAWAIFVLLLGLLVASARGVPMGVVTQAWMYGQVYSWLLGFVVGFLLFVWSYWGCFSSCTPSECDGFCRACCMGEAGASGDKSSTSKYPHGPEYPKDKAMLWENDPCHEMCSAEACGGTCCCCCA